MYLNVPLGMSLVSPRQTINSVSFGRDEDDITCVYGFDRTPKTVVQQCCRFLELLDCQPIIFHLYKLCCDNKIAEAQSIPLTENGLAGPRPNLSITIFVPSLAFFVSYLSYGLTVYYLTAQLLLTLLLILISNITQLSLQTVFKPHLLFPAPQALYFFVR
jgi:hypothetical protein